MLWLVKKSVTYHVDAHLSRYSVYEVLFLCDGKAKLSMLALGRAGVYGEQLADKFDLDFF